MSNAAESPADRSTQLAILKILGLEGGRTRAVGVSSSSLASRLDTSSQTVSNLLQQLDKSGLIEREIDSGRQLVSITTDGTHVLRREYEEYRHLFDDGASA